MSAEGNQIRPCVRELRLALARGAEGRVRELATPAVIDELVSLASQLEYLLPAYAKETGERYPGLESRLTALGFVLDDFDEDDGEQSAT